MSRPVVPWVGGKRRLASRILPLFPEHTCYVEPFAGGAALLFAKEPAGVEVLDDVDGELVTLYRVVQRYLEPFIQEFKWVLTSREEFERLDRARAEDLLDIQRAARTFYLQKLGFGARAHGRTFGISATAPPKLNLLRIEEDLSEAHLRLARVTIERLDWARCIERYDRPGTLFYCDPPYWGVAGYGVPFPIGEYERMAELARSIAGRMIISVNDAPEMRRVFKGMPTTHVQTAYQVGGAANRKPARELIMRSWA